MSKEGIKDGTFEFGKRKILAVHYTRYISLPKEWLRNHNLEKGDRLEILLTDNGNLLIRPEDSPPSSNYSSLQDKTKEELVELVQELESELEEARNVEKSEVEL